jgi:hypothetical protein
VRSNTLHLVSTPKPRNVRPIGTTDRGGAQRLWIATATGLAVGLIIFSLPAAFGALWAGMAWVPGFILALAAGLLIGLLIEFVTSVVFGARAGVRVIS